jgi:hypothetical protein
MSKTLLLASVLVAAVSAQAIAQQTFQAFGSNFTVSNFEPRQMMVATATDRKTGRQFNVVKMQNGGMMAIVPLNSMRRMPRVSRSDIMR